MTTFDATVLPRLCLPEQQVFGLALFMTEGRMPADITRPFGMPIDAECATDIEVLAHFLGQPIKAVEKVWAMLEEKGAVRA